MRLNVVLRYVGLILLLDAAFMLLSVVVSLLGGMDTGFYPLLQSFVLTAILGAFPLIFVPRGGQITSKEGYAIVVGAWLMSCLAGMLPYVLWGGEFSVSDAWFEAVSGERLVRKRFGLYDDRIDQPEQCGGAAAGASFLASLDPLVGRRGRCDVRSGRPAVDGIDQDAPVERRAFVHGQG